MSPEERARAAAAAVMDNLSDRSGVLDGIDRDICAEIEAEIADAIAAAIRADVAAETERCAALVDTMATAVAAQPFADSLRALARGIRTTGPAGTPPA